MQPKLFLTLVFFAFVQFCVAQNTPSNLNITSTLSLCEEGAADTYLASGAPTINYGNHASMGGNTWTCGGSLCLSRALFKFNLSNIPSNAVINSAYLKLYADLSWSPAATTGGPLNSGTLSRVTSSWNEFTVTWATQPPTSGVNVVAVPGSIAVAQDYTLNVTNLVLDMLNFGNYGFLLKMDDELMYYKSLMFAASNNSDKSKCPQLLINYTTELPNGLASEAPADASLRIFPSPFGHELSFRSNSIIGRVVITDALGKTCWSEQLNSREITLEPELPAGIYSVLVYDNAERQLGVERVVKTE